MTSKEIRDALNEAARSDDKDLALRAAKEFANQGLWTSTPHFVPSRLDGTEELRTSQYPGICVECQKDFTPGTTIMWRSRVAAHLECYEKWSEKNNRN